MIAYENLLNIIKNDKHLEMDFKKQKDITYEKYPLKKFVINQNIIPYKKINYINEDNFVYKKIDYKIDKTINDIFDLDAVRKKPIEYYQYNMKDKNISDMRLSELQKENNILSEFELLKEQKETGDSLENLRDLENDYQTNLMIVLNNKKSNEKLIDINGDTKYKNDVSKLNNKYKKKIPLLVTKAIPQSILKVKEEEKLDEKIELKGEPITQYNTPIKLLINEKENEEEKIELKDNEEEKLDEKGNEEKIIDNYLFVDDKEGENINEIRREIFKTVTNNFNTNGKFIEENRNDIYKYLSSFGLKIIPRNYVNEQVIKKYMFDYLKLCNEIKKIDITERKESISTIDTSFTSVESTKK